MPENEFSAMKLAQVIGVNIPEIKLVELRNLVNLPDIPLPDEPYAYAIRRFDRTDEGRVHTEDFAQIFRFMRGINIRAIATTILVVLFTEWAREESSIFSRWRAGCWRTF